MPIHRWAAGAGRRGCAGTGSRAAVAFALGAVWLAAGCSSYVATSQKLRPQVVSGDYQTALEEIRSLNSGTSRLLYLYERALILNQESEFAASNAALDSAEVLLEDLYTRSVSREAAALLVNEGTREYRGERFEAAILHYFRIMNSINLGDFEAAAVQARRLAHRLAVYQDDADPVYAADPFLEYLSGMVFDAAGDADEALVAYRRALAAYTHTPQAGDDLPPRLYCDLAAAAARLGEAEEAARARAEGGCPDRPGGPPPGTLRLFLACGFVAHRSAEELLLPIFTNEVHDDLDVDAFATTMVSRYGQPYPHGAKIEYMLRISLPVLVDTPSGIAHARITAIGGDGGNDGHTSAVVAADVSARARRAFTAARPAIFFRAVVRGLAKYLAKRKAEKQGGEVAGWAMNLAGVLTETADTRCWSLLPEKILLAQLDLPAGEYRLEVELLGPTGAIEDRFEIPAVRVTSGTTLVDYRVH